MVDFQNGEMLGHTVVFKAGLKPKLCAKIRHPGKSNHKNRFLSKVQGTEAKQRKPKGKN